MHTVLDAGPPIGFQGCGTRQPTLILKWIDTHTHVQKNVMEVGCGRGYCTLFLAGLTGDNVHFHGIDLLKKHIDCACKLNVHVPRVQFHVEDAYRYNPQNDLKFDIIFGCESMCHLDPDEFIQHAKEWMNPGAKLIIIDGFRGPHWSDCDEMYRTAMRLAEYGFRINGMPSKAMWKNACERAGLRLLDDIDLTNEAIPFWSLGHRIASIILQFPWLVRRYMNSSEERKETVSNLIASCMVSHALVGKSAEYGGLVFEYI